MTSKNDRRFSGPLEAPAASERQPNVAISSADVSAWMRSEDLQVLAATDVLVDQAHHSISPHLTLDDVDEFRRAFYRRCLREDPQGDWAPSREAAAWELANWLGYLARESAGVALLTTWRDWLAEEYTVGDAAIRECLITGTLGRVFRQPALRYLFEVWKGEDVLSEAYTKAAAFVGR
jgi:hypothetical protein